MITFELTPEALIAASAFVLALLLAYVPGLKTKFDSLDGTVKRACVAGLIFVIGLGGFGLDCAGWLDATNVACTRVDLVQVVQYILLALSVNQGTYLLFVRRAK